MLFSIITPSYNTAARLDVSFASVVAQEEGLYDYWTIAAALNDGTREWLEICKNPDFHLISENGYGVYDAMN